MEHFLKLFLVYFVGMAFFGLIYPGPKREGRRPSRLGVFVTRAFIAACVFGLNVRYAPANVDGLLAPAESRSQEVLPPEPAEEQAEQPERPLETTGPAGGMVVAYREVYDPQLMEWQTWARERRMLEQFAEWTNGWIQLPDPVTLTFSECGHANAYYRGEYRQIDMCLEQLAAIRDRLAYRVPDERIGAGVEGAAYFILSHELGHALVHMLHLPVTGREEDAVDQLAAYVMMDGSEEGRDAALFWAMSLPSEHDLTFYLSDEHSLTPQRRFNLLCWMYGQNPERNAHFISNGMLPEKRAQRCPHEYAQLRDSWDRLLYDYRSAEP
jgi:hypothetical protein